ncbi:MAG: transglutaminase domain-containing protein [Gammaproteobacteria bacterium]|nr:transglutaminase domain-containing protein [Gammaproteobacteria bacterium]
MLNIETETQGQSSRSQFLPTSLRASIIAASYWILSLSLTNLSGSVASFVGCLLGCYLVDHFINRQPLNRYKTVFIIAVCSLFLVSGLLLSDLIVASTMLAGLVSPMNSYNAGEFIKWFLISAAITSILRTCAHRTRFGAVLEILFVTTAFIITLSAHRNGMIHRPYFIGDFALMRGVDPASILMAMGSGAVLCLAALLMVESNHRRLPYHFSILALLCFSLLGYVQFFGLPSPQYTDDLGLTGAEQGNNASQSDNPFRDSENNPENLEAPVAIVLFRDDYEPVNGSYYFRETAYSQYNGSLLDTTNRDDMDQDLVSHFTNTRVAVSEALPGQDSRSKVRTSIGMLTPHRSPFGLESPLEFINTPNPNNLRFKRTYDVVSMAPVFSFDDLIGQETGAEFWSEEVWDEYLQLPDDPRYRELATDLIANLKPEYADDPFAWAYSIKTHLDENGIYSLKNDHAYEADPAASFLFGDLTGYCMHFAFSATYMFRSLGIPARVGIGYSVPASNRAGGSSLLIQAIHGHAWPEVYFRDLGWVIIDPAPQQTLVDMTTDPQNSLQQLLGDMLRNEASFDEFLNSQPNPLIPLETILTFLSLLAAAVLATAYGVKYYRLWVPQYSARENQYRLSYRAVLDRLSSSGIRRNTGESREAFASRVGDMAPSFKTITQQHLYCALGTGNSLNVQEETFNWNSVSHEIQQQLGKQLPLWKKVLAAINPFSWLTTR